MSTKIPVGAVIARTYGFAFGNFINNLGATWIPQAILLAGNYFLVTRYSGVMKRLVTIAPVSADATQNDAAVQAAAMQNLHEFVAIAPMLGLVYLIAVLCSCAMFVGITKEALGARTGSAFLQNPLGAATWRVLGALVLYLLLMIALYIAFVILVAGGAAATVVVGSTAGKAGLGLAVALVAIAFGLGLVYVAVRAGYLIAPAVVAEHRVTLAAGWRLARGNFWRIVVVCLAVILPVIVAELAWLSTIMGSVPMPPMHPGMTPQEFQAWSQQFNVQMLVALESLFRRWWYIVFPAFVLVSTLLNGLFAGASAFSYRALSGDGEATA
jgi:hypothetical protein